MRILKALTSAEVLESRVLLAADVTLQLPAPNLVADLALGSALAELQGATIGDRLVFAQHQLDTGIELWTSDGTPEGTQRLKDIFPGQWSSEPKSFFSFNGFVYFTADDGEHGRELWRSDGTAAGTTLVSDTAPGMASGSYLKYASLGERLYFSDGTQSSLWSTDGTPEGTQQVYHWTGETKLADIAAIGTRLALYVFIKDVGNTVWTSDGTASGTYLVKDPNPASPDGWATHIGTAGGLAFFTAGDGVHGTELWRTDGTASGTFMVKDIMPGMGSGLGATESAELNGRLFFAADDGEHGREVWVSDGTESGTQLVADIIPGTPGTSPGEVLGMHALNGSVIFSNNAGQAALWRTDGTPEGTSLLVTTDAFRTWGVVQGKLLFGANYQLWQTDGTAEGTFERLSPGNIQRLFPAESGAFVQEGSRKALTFLKDEGYSDLASIAVAPAGAFPSSFVQWRGSTYFEGDHGLWRTDGTAAGTVRVLSGIDIHAVYSVADMLLYAHSEQGQTQLWRSGGTPGSDQLLHLFPFGELAAFTEFAGAVYFLSSTFSGLELWRTTGTADGTTFVARFSAVQSVKEIPQLAVLNGRMYFHAADAASGSELWASDGTSDGTRLVKDIVAGPESSTPRNVTVALGKVFFTATSAGYRALWCSDGTEAGTYPLGAWGNYDETNDSGLIEVNGKVLFSPANTTMWLSDGTPVGTTYVRVKEGFTDAVSLGGSRLLLRSGADIWTYDVETNTEVMRRQVANSPYQIGRMVLVNGLAYFVATDDAHGQELWASDGSAEGTVVFDIRRGSQGSLPSDLTAVGDKLYLSADDGVHGGEFWAVDTTADMEVTGTDEADAIAVGIVGDRLRVTVNAAATEYPLNTVSSLTIDGLGGNDLITVDPSITWAITIYGGAGDDSITGGAGANVIYGGDGNDRIKGRNSADTIYGEAGDDWIAGMDGADQIDGGSGMDRIYGGIAADVIAGGDDSDTIYGGAGADVIDAGGGNDIVLGENDADSILGGDGNDTLRGNFGADTIDGGLGGDQLQGDLDDDELHGGSGTDLLNGGPGDDLLYGEGHRDRLIGADGHDQLWGGRDYDSLYGGLGNDWLYGEDGDDLLGGGMDGDVLTGGRGRDTLLGDAGNDILFSGGDTARDLLRGDSGLDSFQVDSLDALLDVAEVLDIA